jgi:outer membrane protein assembly factor BamB
MPHRPVLPSVRPCVYDRDQMRVLGLSLIVLAGSRAADWPQWGGPNRDFRLPTGTKVPRWPASGPRQLWTRDLGDGYSSMAISGGALYTMYRKGSQDVVIALDPATGKTVWESAIDAPHAPGMNIEAGPGPHSTPLTVGGRIFVTTVIGNLVALELKTGRRLWSHDLWKEFKGTCRRAGHPSHLAHRQ